MARIEKDDWVTVKVDPVQEGMAYLIAKLVLQDGCPRCGCVGRHNKDCALSKLIINFESNLARLPDTAFE